MLMNARIPSRFVGIAPREFVVVGLSFKPTTSGSRTGYGNVVELKFKIGDVEKPLDFVSALHISEQKIIN
jgi:hypothetical protein